MFKSCCAHAIMLIALVRNSNNVDLVCIVMKIVSDAKIVFSSVNEEMTNIKYLS